MPDVIYIHIYDILQTMAKNEIGRMNNANGMTYDEYKNGSSKAAGI